MNTIEQLNERITQLTELVKTGSEAIKSMETALKAAEEERDRLVDHRSEQEPKFERVKEGEKYYTIDFGCNKGCVVFGEEEEGHSLDEAAYANNNYFHTKERAKEVTDKINFLLKLERLHDTFCPSYAPDWDDWCAEKWEIDYENSQGRYRTLGTPSTENKTAVYFPTQEIAQKVCDILNAELEER